jgi:hypothetical protein
MATQVNSWSFRVAQGGVNIDGKNHYPDCINIRMDRWRALEIISQLASGLQSPEKEEFDLGFCGVLEEGR